MSITRVPLLVVGGGIGGLAAALALSRTGREVRLIEQAPELTEIGAGLQVGPNASRALDKLGVLDEAAAAAVRPERATMLDAFTGGPLTVLDLTDSFRERYGYPYLVLHRRDLLDVLLRHCVRTGFVTVETNKTVTAVQADDHSAAIRCADGSVFRCDALIGADGLRSMVRRAVSRDSLVDSGLVGYRGTSPAKTESNAEVTIWIGPGLHVVRYPIRRGEIENHVVVAPAGQDLDEVFADTHPQARRSVSLVARERYWPIYDREPLPTWRRGRAVLLGDAAHPMLQYLGQGAGQALEDAIELSRQLDAAGGDIDTAFHQYEETRRPRATRCQTIARVWGALWHTDDVVVRGLRDRVFAQRAADDFTDLDWLYGDTEEGQL